MAEALTESEVKELVDGWYRKLDVHAPVDEVLPLAADDGLEMVFPEATLHGHADLRNWYETVTRRFFDEVHEMRQLDISPNGDRADVKLVVNWQARIWDPPEAKSKWLGFDAYQTWVVERAADGKPVITRYVVDDLAPMPGSASL
jgi:hypothetical protein